MKTLKIDNKRIKLQIWVSLPCCFAHSWLNVFVLLFRTQLVMKDFVPSLRVITGKSISAVSDLSLNFLLFNSGALTESFSFTTSQIVTPSCHFRNGLVKLETTQRATLFALSLGTNVIWQGNVKYQKKKLKKFAILFPKLFSNSKHPPKRA